MKTKINSVISIGILVFIAMACNASFSTANMSALKFGKNDKADPATTNFNQGDKVFVVATVANSMSKTKVKFKIEGVGTPLSKEIDMPSSGDAYLEITNVAAGEYKAEVTLVDESGKELDKKSGSFSVKGDSTKTESPKNPTNADKDAETEDAEK
ncbi:MAG TPA: hypothetical protein PKE69_14200 [Pyrinomonadaceae bacterium]|nr:hypothetical protein [Pyrinomonadaceae bacterium]